jgi:hypothetical protein
MESRDIAYFCYGSAAGVMLGMVTTNVVWLIVAYLLQ